MVNPMELFSNFLVILQKNRTYIIWRVILKKGNDMAKKQNPPPANKNQNNSQASNINQNITNFKVELKRRSIVTVTEITCNQQSAKYEIELGSIQVNKNQFQLLMDRMDAGFATVNSRLDTIEKDVKVLKKDVKSLKKDVKVLKTDVAAIKACPTVQKELNTL